VAPYFTVVIPAFDAQTTLTAAVSSVLAQTDADLEVVIVDDGSTDATPAVARGINDPRVKVISQANRGLPAARNAGTAASAGEIVCFLDSDDLLMPRYLEAVRSVFTHDPGVDFVYTDAWTFDDRTRRIREHTTAHYQRPPRPVPADALAMFRELVARNFMIVPVAVRREVLVAAGGFDETMTSVEDWDLWLRLTASGHRGAEAPGPLGLRREHTGQMTGNYARMAQNQVHALDKLLTEYHLAEPDAELVRARLEVARSEHRILSGADRPRAAARRLKWRLGAVRRRVGLGARWYPTPPLAITAAFGDLARVDEVAWYHAAGPTRDRADGDRVAYVLLTHRAPAQIRRLVDRLLRSDPAGLVVVNHDAASTPLDLGPYADDPRVHVRPASPGRRWGSYALAADLLQTIGWAVDHLDAGWLAILSGQDYPLRSLEPYGRQLSDSGLDAFVTARPVAPTRPPAADSGAVYTYVRYFFRWRELPGWVLGWVRGDRAVGLLRGAQRRLSMAQPFVFWWSLPSGGGDMIGVRRRTPPFTTGFTCYKGSQWMTLSRRAALALVAFTRAHPEVLKVYRESLIADESLPVTILCNDPGLRVATENHHFIRMDGGGEAHAAALTLADLEALRASGRWFARKFDEAADGGVLDQLDGDVLGSS
jgi:glycosyltransferase involved in cell wall biosynthesis